MVVKTATGEFTVPVAELHDAWCAFRDDSDDDVAVRHDADGHVGRTAPFDDEQRADVLLAHPHGGVGDAIARRDRGYVVVADYTDGHGGLRLSEFSGR